MKQPNIPWPMKLLALPIIIIYKFFRVLVILTQIVTTLLWRKVTKGNITKREGNTLKTPIITLCHPRTDTKVVLFGMIHLGNKDYYQLVEARVKELEQYGYQVLYEMVKKNSDEELSTLSKKERKVLRALYQISDGIKKCGAILNLAHQKEAIAIGENWINTDMTIAEMAKSVARRHKFRHPKLPAHKGDEPIIRYFLGRALLSIETIRLMSAFKSEEKQLEARILDEIILGQRNSVAVGEIVRFSNQNVTALWGAAHLPGIIDTLKKEHGYELVSREWIPAYTRTYFYGDMMRELKETKSKGV